MQAETDDARKFLKWVGLSLPARDSLKGLSAAGAFHVTGPTLTFDDGTFTLDGNKAVGLLALTARDRDRALKVRLPSTGSCSIPISARPTRPKVSRPHFH